MGRFPSASATLRWLVILGAVVVCVPESARAARRHHITLGLGYTKHLSSDLKDESLGVDLTNAGSGVLAYRYSVNPQIDLSIDSRATISMDTYSGVDITLTNSFFGPGVRWHTASPSPFFLQGNVFLVNEDVHANQGAVSVSGSDSSAGFGLFGGIDLRLSDLLSLPLEVSYLYGKPGDDVSGIGMNIGIAWNFGQMP